MLVTVKLFARLRELAHTGELSLDVADGSLVRDVWQVLAERHAGIAAYASSISCAVNTDYSRMTAAVKEGDEIAFLPPVSGG